MFKISSSSRVSLASFLWRRGTVQWGSYQCWYGVLVMKLFTRILERTSLLGPVHCWKHLQIISITLVLHVQQLSEPQEVAHIQILFKILFIYFGNERGRETSMCGCLSCVPTGDLACNASTCPDWDLNQGPFGSQACAQSTELQQPG